LGSLSILSLIQYILTLDIYARCVRASGEAV
jgi:hypothetical protein